MFFPLWNNRKCRDIRDVTLRRRSRCSYHRLQTCSSFLFIPNLATTPAPFSLKDVDWSYWALLKNDPDCCFLKCQNSAISAIPPPYQVTVNELILVASPCTIMTAGHSVHWLWCETGAVVTIKVLFCWGCFLLQQITATTGQDKPAAFHLSHSPSESPTFMKLLFLVVYWWMTSF